MKNGMKRLLTLIVLMAAMSVTAQNDTITFISDLKHEALVSTKETNKVISKMDSLYYVNPLRNKELCLMVYVNNKLDFHRHYKRKEELKTKQIK